MKSTLNKLHQQAQQALNEQNYQLAHQLLLTLLQQDKYFADAYFLLAMIASAHLNKQKTIQLIKQAMVLDPDNAEYIAHLAKHYALFNDHVLAKQYAELAAQKKITSALTFDTLGVTYSQIGLHQQAVVFFKQAVALTQSNATFYFNLGASLKFIGDFEGARSAYEQTLKLAPHFCKAHAALTSLGGISPQKNHLPQLNDLYQQLTKSDDLLYVGHALAREYEALDDYAQAFHYLSVSKQNKLAELDYSIAQDQAMFAALTQLFSHHSNELSQGFSSDEALFVVGMPRTGTTLVERILSKHQQVTSAGELQHFGLLFKELANTRSNRVIDADTVNAATNIDFAQLGKKYINSTRAITGNTAKFVDKMPLNVLYAGFIIKALPQAKIICLDRNPLDTIVSNYRQLFAVNFSYYNYAYDLQTTAQFYLLFKDLISFWQQQFPDNFYIVNYEKLVNQPEIEAKKLLAFCGLSWQPQCLNIDQNSAPVATASAVQVRQPINNRSIGNWQKYQPHLVDIIKFLEQNHVLND